jgi:hypothetical protein
MQHRAILSVRMGVWRNPSPAAKRTLRMYGPNSSPLPSTHADFKARLSAGSATRSSREGARSAPRSERARDPGSGSRGKQSTRPLQRHNGKISCQLLVRASVCAISRMVPSRCCQSRVAPEARPGRASLSILSSRLRSRTMFAAPAFSSMRSGRRVPGIGTMSGP